MKLKDYYTFSLNLHNLYLTTETSGDEQTALLCMNRHPTEPSLLACGSESGTVCFWDLRQEKYPATVLSAHNGPGSTIYIYMYILITETLIDEMLNICTLIFI